VLRQAFVLAQVSLFARATGRRPGVPGACMKILIAEDHRESARQLERALTSGGHSVVTARDGAEALERFEQEPCEVVVTDWMMPRIDGIELIQRLRSRTRPAPVIIMTTATSSAEARAHALESGADDFVAKPVDADEVLSTLNLCLARRRQAAEPMAAAQIAPPEGRPGARPPFVGVAIAASSGGPAALRALFRSLPLCPGAGFLVAQHAPAWMLDSLASQLRRESALGVRVAEPGDAAAEGHVVIAPAERDLRVSPGSMGLTIDHGPTDDLIRPSADRLFQSAATAFGPWAIGVVLTGLGRDGAVGAVALRRAGAVVLAEDPASATAGSTPQNVVAAGVATQVVPLGEMGRALAHHIQVLAADLRSVRNGDTASAWA
jgi:two-component system chemotaxis response regulator CheB